jgi:hypothetical protein
MMIMAATSSPILAIQLAQESCSHPLRVGLPSRLTIRTMAVATP